MAFQPWRNHRFASLGIRRPLCGRTTTTTTTTKISGRVGERRCYMIWLHTKRWRQVHNWTIPNCHHLDIILCVFVCVCVWLTSEARVLEIIDALHVDQILWECTGTSTIVLAEVTLHRQIIEFHWTANEANLIGWQRRFKKSAYIRDHTTLQMNFTDNFDDDNSLPHSNRRKDKLLYWQ